MASQDNKPLRWGILATGFIAEKFTKDLLTDPSTRYTTPSVAHTVTAAASSSSASRAADFLKRCGCPADATPHASYAALAADPAVDIVYVATPHSHHFQNVMLCLRAGKHVLCEKAFTVNAAQAKALYEAAEAKGVFLMEAVWIRFFPLCAELRRRVAGGEVGDVHRVFADLSRGSVLEEEFADGGHRMVNMDLAGGALLDLGIYAITWVFQFLYHVKPVEERRRPRVLGSIGKYAGTGADELTSMVFSFPAAEEGKAEAHGIATTNMRVCDDVSSAGPAIRIQGTKGEIQVAGPAYRPEKFRVVEAGKTPDDAKWEQREIPGHGMFWEADECFKCIREGKLQSEVMSWGESELIMEVMDEVRKQGGLKYPDRIESTEYPLDGF